jgi:hypothetical protein
LNSRSGAGCARDVLESDGGWAEEAGEVELIGGWTQVALTDVFVAQIDTSNYQVFLSSYDAVLVFAQNRLPRSFEIHAAPAQHGKRAKSTWCAYRVVAPRLRWGNSNDVEGGA